MALDKKNLLIRTASGLVYAGLLVGAIVIDALATAILMAVLAVIASFEMSSNTVGRSNPGRWTMTWFIDGASLVFLMFSFLSISRPQFLICCWFFVICLFLRFFIQIFIGQKNAIQSVSIYAFEQLYIGVPLGLLVAVVGAVSNPWIVVCAVAMIWINDTGAYLVGCTMGRHKISPRLSPKKTWEGFLGGLIFNIGAAFIYFYCFHLTHGEFISNVMGWIYIGFCVSAFATLGDLFESLLKRSLDIKDFGNAIPGHGGVLDRIDSLLAVVPCTLVACALGVWMFGV